MNDGISVTELTHSNRKRRTKASQLLPASLLFLAAVAGTVPRFSSALKSPDIFSLLLPRNNEGGTNFCRRRREFSSVEPPSLTKISTALPSSLSPFNNIPHQSDQVLPSASLFPTHRPLLAIITETDACDTEEKMKHTYATVKRAASTDKVDLVSVRLSLPPRYDENGDENDSYHHILERASRLTKNLVELSLKQKQEHQLRNQDDEDKEKGNTDMSQQPHSSCSFKVVCSSDLVSVAVNSRANGVHVKEHHLDQLPDIIRRFEYPIVIGTSTHSVESALRSYFGNDDSKNIDEDESAPRAKITKTKPHYYFVGTCYMTASHPEKTLQSQLEGPELPGRIKRALFENLESKQQQATISTTATTTTKDNRKDLTPVAALQSRLPWIMAIGGIDETNCHEPVALGADGVAVIRAVLQADHPIERVEEMQSSMMRTYRV
jgi:thiamine monophosphate synthase